MARNQDLWIETSDLFSMFPTLVWKIELRTEVHKPINEKIIEVLNRMRQSMPDLAPGEAWQSNQALHKLEELRELVSYINSTIKRVLQFLRIGYDAFEITACWANFSARGASHRAHSHPNNFLSGVYYVSTEEGADTINFHDPRNQTSIIRPPVTELTAVNTDQVVVKVKDGTLLVFPSYLQHSVDPNMSDSVRVSVSFNIMFSLFTEKLSKPLWGCE